MEHMEENLLPKKKKTDLAFLLGEIKDEECATPIEKYDKYMALVPLKSSTGKLIPGSRPI